MSGNIFQLSQMGEECYWSLIGRNQRCCKTSYSAQDSAMTENETAQNVQSVKVEKT